MRFKLAIGLLLALLVGSLLFIRHAPTAQQEAVKTTTPKVPNDFASSGKSRSSPSTRNEQTHRLLKGEELPKLTVAQVAEYLRANHRNAESLLGALYTTGDRAFLQEAMEKFPHDPKVDFAALFMGKLSPEDARKWADNFKRSDPNNPMADYASALNYLKAGQTDAAMQDLAASGNKSKWNDYSYDFLQSTQEAYRSAGYSDLDSLMISSMDLQLPHLAPLKQLGVQLGNLATTLQQSGDAAGAQNALQMDLRFGQQLAESQTQPLITSLVGYAVERIALGGMDPNAPYDSSGTTVQDQINAMKQQRSAITDLTKQSEAIRPYMSDEDLQIFYERRTILGPMNAMQWVVNKYGQQPAVAPQ